eukprot:tig00020710_g13304.t1
MRPRIGLDKNPSISAPTSSSSSTCLASRDLARHPGDPAAEDAAIAIYERAYEIENSGIAKVLEGTEEERMIETAPAALRQVPVLCHIYLCVPSISRPSDTDRQWRSVELNTAHNLHVLYKARGREEAAARCLAAVQEKRDDLLEKLRAAQLAAGGWSQTRAEERRRAAEEKRRRAGLHAGGPAASSEEFFGAWEAGVWAAHRDAEAKWRAGGAPGDFEEAGPSLFKPLATGLAPGERRPPRWREAHPYRGELARGPENLQIRIRGLVERRQAALAAGQRYRRDRLLAEVGRRAGFDLRAAHGPGEASASSSSSAPEPGGAGPSSAPAPAPLDEEEGPRWPPELVSPAARLSFALAGAAEALGDVLRAPGVRAGCEL